MSNPKGLSALEPAAPQEEPDNYYCAKCGNGPDACRDTGCHGDEPRVIDITDEMVEAGYRAFSGKMLMYEEDKTLVRSVIEAALAASSAVPDDEHRCPVCNEPFKLGDQCASDIELGMCHAECLEGSPTVDLDTGEPVDGPIPTYPYEPYSGVALSFLSPTASVSTSQDGLEAEESPSPTQPGSKRTIRPAAPEGWQAAVALTYGQRLIAEAIEHHFGERGHNFDEYEGDTTVDDVWDAFDALTRPAEQAVTEAMVDAAISAAATYCWERYKGRHPLNLSSPAVFTSHEHQKIEDFIRSHLAALKAAMEADHG